ncbi:hypothetical protein O6H91_19G068800 [Diphasiastrum complanatum]|uniref:Uncharacterized protein n=1 Tax=Diphasiastrum complanatum TaxID=34168 RepID=A0ACC2AW85_DIPCM|nr:hypothetical protein O6H91_19G068800 [Diphasiastrum complanatum]
MQRSLGETDVIGCFWRIVVSSCYNDQVFCFCVFLCTCNHRVALSSLPLTRVLSSCFCVWLYNHGLSSKFSALCLYNDGALTSLVRCLCLRQSSTSEFFSMASLTNIETRS